MIKRAVVLAGGGARGPYQVGVWRGLRELGIEYHIVTGTSVGALNGAMMVQGSYEKAKEMWENLTTQNVVSVPDFQDATDRRKQLGDFVRTMVENGGLDVSPLEGILRGVIDEDKIYSSDILFGLVTTEFPRLKPLMLTKDQIPKGELVNYLLASASYFPFFQRRNIGGVSYIDGAYADNMPANLAIEMGAEEIIAVDLQSIGMVHPYKGDIPVIYLSSYWNLGQTLLFDPTAAKRNMALGYNDVMKGYKKLEGQSYTFCCGETRKNAKALHDFFYAITKMSGVDTLSQYYRLPLYKKSRFIKKDKEVFSFGRAVTTSGEILGEILKILPENIYKLEEFNRLCLENWTKIKNNKSQMGNQDAVRLKLVYKQLKHACLVGKTSDAFWAVVSLAPRELMAANYLLALEMQAGIN